MFMYGIKNLTKIKNDNSFNNSMFKYGIKTLKKIKKDNSFNFTNLVGMIFTIYPTSISAINF